MHATIIMEGRLVTDPEIKSGKNGDYCTFRFVVNTKYGKPKGDEADSSQGTAKTAQKSTGKVRPEQTIPSGDDDDDLPL